MGAFVTAEAVRTSTDLSLWVQILTGLVGVQGSFAVLPKEHAILGSALQLETVVQLVEFVFYAGFLADAPLEGMAATRYYDWALTTPTMLLSTMVVMKYEELAQAGASTDFTLAEFVTAHKKDITTVALANWAMLLVGYLGERGVLGMGTSLTLGFAFFAWTFSIIRKYAATSETGKKLFTFVLVVWGLYGVAAPMDAASKNLALNSLDIVAKNFFGLYLYAKVMKLRVK
jgi:hypothetical protein